MGTPVYRILAGNPPRRTQDAEGNLLLWGRHCPQLHTNTLPGEYIKVVPHERHLKSSVIRMSVQQLLQANEKDHIKALHYCPFAKESTDNWWISHPKCQKYGKRFKVITRSLELHVCERG